VEPLQRLYEREGLPAYEMPIPLEELYAGAIGFPPRALVTNFVSSIDGVVALESVQNAPSFISGKSEHDRFVMGLLRSCAGAVVIGANTLRAEPEHRWTPDYIYPDLAHEYAELRRNLALSETPELVVVSASGDLDPAIPALEGAVIVTTSGGGEEIARRHVPATDVIELAGDDSIDSLALLEALRRRGHNVILSEAGPRLTAQFLRDGLLDELFLTLSPVVLGRDDEERPSLAGADLVDAGPPGAQLLSIRRAESHLFVRFGLQ
jgi:riboflavin biosynthesis pyrimidine reductase